MSALSNQLCLLPDIGEPSVSFDQATRTGVADALLAIQCAAVVNWIERVKRGAWRLKSDVLALWIAARSHLTPLAARLTAGAVAAYALSPIDLIPDFIPIVGYLDDLLILPFGIALAIRLIPPPLLRRFRAEAAARSERPRSYVAAALIAILWVLAGVATVAWVWR